MVPTMFTITIKNHAPWSGPLVCVLTYQKGLGPRWGWKEFSFYRCRSMLEFTHHAITSPGILWASLYWRPFPWSDAKLIGRMHWHQDFS